MNLNKQTATYIFIFIFIIITFIHLFKINNNNNKENFIDLNESQNLQGYDVFINSMSQVKFINENNNRETLQTIIDNKDNIIDVNNKINDAISDKVTKTELNDAMPELSIISYAGSNPPTGWQPCDGKLLEYSNSNNRPVRIDDTRTINFNEANGFRKTPDLRGRFILGSGKVDGLTQRDIHTNGGEENVTLTVEQMPAHNHNYIEATQTNFPQGYTGGGFQLNNQQYKNNTTTSNGNNSPHNNMPPYYVLTYIIKQPSPPTSS